MGIALRRLTAVIASSTIVGAGALIASPANAATTYTVNSTVTLGNGAAAQEVAIAVCPATSDCMATGQVADYEFVTDGKLDEPLDAPAGKDVFAVEYLDLENGYGESSGAFVPEGYLAKPAGATSWTVVDTLAQATQETIKANTTINFAIGAAIHNPQSKFTQRTSGTIDGQPCAAHTTTINPTPFSDLPANGKVTYEWYYGTDESHLTKISGASGLSYTPGANLVGQSLYTAITATAPNRVPFEGSAYLGEVGNPRTCVAPPPALPSSDIKSFGKKSGKPVHGKKVKVKGAKAVSGVAISYNWTLNGKVVHHGKSYKLPKSAKHKKLAVQVVFSRAGYEARSKTIKFGKVK